MITLASSSPRRAELLRQIGVKFEIITVDVDETSFTGEVALDYIRRMAKTKTKTGHELLLKQAESKPVLAADTIIAIDDKIIGKPTDRQQCQCILSQLSAREHQVISAVAL